MSRFYIRPVTVQSFDTVLLFASGRNRVDSADVFTKQICHINHHCCRVPGKGFNVCTKKYRIKIISCYRLRNGAFGIAFIFKTDNGNIYFVVALIPANDLFVYFRACIYIAPAITGWQFYNPAYEQHIFAQ